MPFFYEYLRFLATYFRDFNYLTIRIFNQKVQRLFAADFVLNALDLNLEQQLLHAVTIKANVSSAIATSCVCARNNMQLHIFL